MASTDPFRLSVCRVVLLLQFCASGCAFRDVQPELKPHSPGPFSESGEATMPARWWTAFGDAQLNEHVGFALGENLELGVAIQRLRAARALVRREASDLLPDIDGLVSMDRTFGPGRDRRQITAGVDAAWQLDIWGQIQSRVDAECFRASATESDYHAVALSLAAEVARTWYSLIEARAQLRLLEQQIDNNREGADFQKKRFSVGQSDAADVYRQDQLVQSTLEQEVVVRAQIELLEHQLAVLRGEYPQSARFESGTDLPGLPPLPAAGLPSELVQRRPDVRSAYQSFLAADSDLAAAITDQYPRLNLTGSLVNSASSPERLFQDWFLSVGAQLVGPIVDGGQRRAEVDRTEAIVRQRFDQYGQTMLIAFQEVEDNLALERYQVQRIDRLKAQVSLAQRASERLLNQSAIGDVNYLDVLSAIQTEQRLQREMLSARLELILIRIRLYLALAGDFDTGPRVVEDLGSDPGDLMAEDGAMPPNPAVPPVLLHPPEAIEPDE